MKTELQNIRQECLVPEAQSQQMMNCCTLGHTSESADRGQRMSPNFLNHNHHMMIDSSIAVSSSTSKQQQKTAANADNGGLAGCYGQNQVAAFPDQQLMRLYEEIALLKSSESALRGQVAA